MRCDEIVSEASPDGSPAQVPICALRFSRMATLTAVLRCTARVSTATHVQLYIEALRKLLDAGAKPSATDDYGRTPCYYANAQLGKIPHSDYQLMLDILCCPRMNLSATIAAEVRQRHGLERAPPLVTGIAAPEGPGGGRDIVHGVRVR